MFIFIIGFLAGVALIYLLSKSSLPKSFQDFQKKCKDNFWSFFLAIIIMVGIFLFFCLPLVFKSLAVNIWGIPTLIAKEGGGSRPLALFDLGPLGDIYGSLNTLFTSITLGIVAYTAGLQRQANEQTFKATEKQLELAQKNHEEQLDESRNSIFSNQFYSLLNFKKDKFNSIELKLKSNVSDTLPTYAKGLSVLQTLTIHFLSQLSKDPNCFNDYDAKEMNEYFFNSCFDYFDDSISPIISYFYIYKNLLRLINDSQLSDEKKAFYLDVLSNSMFQEEQMVLFWISPFFSDLNRSIENSHLLNQIWYDDSLKMYALKFHKPNTFRIRKWLEIFEEEKTPA